MSCWTHETFTDNWIDFSQNYCFTSDSFEVSRDSASNEKTNLTNVYKWIPMTLLLTGILFLLPMRGMKLVTKFWCLDIFLIKRTLDDPLAGLSEANANISASTAARQIDQYLNMKKESKPFLCALTCRIILLLTYVAMKVVYIALSGAVFFFWGWFLNLNFITYGPDVTLAHEETIQNLLNWKLEPQSMPKNVYCSVLVRRWSEVITYQIPCQLNVVDIYQKLFLLVWIWLILLPILNFCQFWVWIVRITCCSRNVGFIKCIVETVRATSTSCDDGPPAVNVSKRKVTSFASNYLKCDGRLLINLLLECSNPHLVYHVVADLFNIWDEQSPTCKESKPMDDLPSTSQFYPPTLHLVERPSSAVGFGSTYQRSVSTAPRHSCVSSNHGLQVQTSTNLAYRFG